MDRHGLRPRDDEEEFAALRSQTVTSNSERSAAIQESWIATACGLAMTRGVGSEKSSEKILSLLRSKPELSAKAVAEQLGISSRAVEKQIGILKNEGHLRRIGPAKGGHWQVL